MPIINARPLWLFLSEPGLGNLHVKELKHLGIVSRKTRPRKLRLRSYDMLVVPDVLVVGDVRRSRISLHTLRCPVFGRNMISEKQIDALVKAYQEENADKFVSTVAGSVFNRKNLMHWIKTRLAERGIFPSNRADARPMWLFVVDEAYYFGFPHQNYHEAPGRSRQQERSGSLPPTIAAAMVFSAIPGEMEVIWDPVVGSGTLLQEAGAVLSDATVIGSDKDPAAIEIASQNLTERHRTQLLIGDIGSINLHRRDVTLTLANPPWGGRFEADIDHKRIIENILRSSLRHAAKRWRACILTPHEDALRTASQSVGCLSIANQATTHVRGFRVSIWNVQRALSE